MCVFNPDKVCLKENVFMRGLLAIIAVMAICLGYILYINGFLVVNTKKALLYIESPRWGKSRNRMKARFLSCSGMVKRVICIKEAKRCQFVLSSDTTKGTVCVEILGRGKEAAASLKKNTPCAVVPTDKTGRYRIKTKFVKADGEYTLF